MEGRFALAQFLSISPDIRIARGFAQHRAVLEPTVRDKYPSDGESYLRTGVGSVPRYVLVFVSAAESGY
jgi:hypothetical protein